MKNLLVTTILIGSSFCASASPKLDTLSHKDYLNNIKTHCSDKWTKRGELDTRMYNHCSYRSKQSLQEFYHFNNKYGAKPWYYKVSYPYCVNKWTQRKVTNIGMIRYCLEHEIDGFLDYKYYRKESSTPNTIDSIAERALERFGSWNMVGYRIKRYLDK